VRRNHLFKYFRSGTSSILKLNITLWPQPRHREDDDISFTMAIYGSPILVDSSKVRAATLRFDSALGALVTADEATGARLLQMAAAERSEAIEMTAMPSAGTSAAVPPVGVAPPLDSSSRPLSLEPMTSVKLVYRPLLPIDPRTLNAVCLHPVYVFFFWATCAATVAVFAVPSLNPTSVAQFTILMIIWNSFIIAEFGRIDRALLYHCVKSFDFIFLFVYMTVFVTLQLYAGLTDPASAFNDTRPEPEMFRANIAAKYAMLLV
jgi:hypothetical protein